MEKDQKFNHQRLLVAGLPAPTPAFAGFPKYMFVGGHNDPASMPVNELIVAAASALAKHGRDLAKYNLGLGPMGHPGLRAHVASKVGAWRGIDCSPDDVLVTHGSNQGIDFVIRLFVNPGDVVLLEEKTYHGAITRFRSAGAELVGMPLDAQGIDVLSLESIVERLVRAGTPPKIIYAIPTIQNPTGSILPLARRHALLALARKHGILVVEDECYADLTFKGVEAPPALMALDPGCVVHIGSLSKSLSPALRLGYVIANAHILALMVSVKNDGGVGAVDQMVAAEFCASHFDDHVEVLRVVLQKKLDVMVRAVEQEFGSMATFERPLGGVFFWLQLPKEIDVRNILKQAADAGISFNAGSEWSVDAQAGRSQIRLCFALPTVDEIQEGVAQLARLCVAELKACAETSEMQ